MREVKVHKTELLAKIQANRDQHRAQYLRAIEGWSQEAAQIMERDIQALKAGERRWLSPIDAPPQDHTRDYDRVLPAIQMSVDEVLTLDIQTFNWYVLDDWSWKPGWLASTSKYMPS